MQCQQKLINNTMNRGLLMGYIFSLVASVFFTLYIILKKLAKKRCSTYTFFVGLGYLTCSVIVFVIMKTIFSLEEPWFDIRLLWACLGGLLWAIALVLFMAAIDRIGVARAGQYKNLQAPIGSLLILFALGEYQSSNLWFILTAIFLTFLGALCYSVQQEEGKIDKVGIMMAVASALCYSANSLIRKMVTGFGFIYSQQAYTSLTITVCLFIFLLFRKNNISACNERENFRKTNLVGLTAGVCYFLASITLTLSYTYISGTVAFTISQLCTVWIALCGVFVFKEICFKKHWARIVLGLVLSFFGILMLTLG